MRTRSRGARRRVIPAALIAVLGLGAMMLVLSPARASTGTISGTVFEDTNRNGVQDSGEAAMGSQQLYLFDGAGQTYLGTVVADSTGHYLFTNLADGDYRVEYASTSWQPLRDAWVPTTTGTIFPRHSVHLTGSAVADFGWRQIVRSTTVGLPLSSFVGANGLTVESYDDAVSAETIYGAVMQALIGAEASHVVVRFDSGSGSTTTTAVQQVNGSYSSFSAVSYVTYSSWLDGGDATLTHEYGHAWSLYNAFIVQQDPTLAAYLAARGLAGDARVGTAYEWSPREMIAEDYRQLFGSANARSSALMNTAIPAASAVPGLADFLSQTFTQAPVAAPAPAPVRAPLVSGLSVSPQPVSKSGTVGFNLSATSAVTVRILNSAGVLVRTLVSGAVKPAGPLTTNWDRKDLTGHRVRSGTYKAVVDVVDAAGRTGTASTNFAVA
jgi:hypothetical protein